MKKLISLLLALCLSVSLAACQGKSDIDENAYDIEGVVEITYSEIDPVCDEEGLRTECEKVLTSMQESDDILLSFVVDSSILIEENELGKYLPDRQLDGLRVRLPWRGTGGGSSQRICRELPGAQPSSAGVQYGAAHGRGHAPSPCGLRAGGNGAEPGPLNASINETGVKAAGI